MCYSAYVSKMVRIISSVMQLTPQLVGGALTYKIRKWRPKQRTAASECCKRFSLTRVNLKRSVKTLSGWEAAHCDEHPFRTKVKVSA